MRVVIRGIFGLGLLLGSAMFACCPASFGDEPAAKQESTANEPRSASQDRILTSLQQTAEALRSRSIEPAEMPLFQELLAAAEALRKDESVPLDRREKWRGLARARLVEGAAVLRRQEAAAAQQAAKAQAVAAKGNQPATIVPPSSTTLAQIIPFGGGTGTPATGGNQNPAAQEAEKLIDLIQEAVRPETWDVNGGQGTIRYWSLGHALIIQNTAEVHERIGGSLLTPLRSR
jgi:hypothetical protein